MITKEEVLAVRSEVAAPQPTMQHEKATGVRTAQLIGTIVKYAALVLIAGFFLLPWVWMISTSLKNPEELAVYPIVWIPDPIRWDNYIEAFRRAEFPRFLWNTV